MFGKELGQPRRMKNFASMSKLMGQGTGVVLERKQVFRDVGRAAVCAGQTICDQIYDMEASPWKKRILLSSSMQFMEADGRS